MEHPRIIHPKNEAIYNSEKMGKTTLFQSERILVGLNAFQEGQEHKIHALALSVDGINAESPSTQDDGRRVFLTNDFRFGGGFADPQVMLLLEAYHNAMFKNFQQLPVPSSFLVNTDGTIGAIYIGAVVPADLLEDLAHLHDPQQVRQKQALPFAGRWQRPPGTFSRIYLVNHLIE